MANRIGERLAETKTMAAAFEMLRSYPTIGEFLAYQFVTDINYSRIVDFSESEFVAVGPGAREGLRKCFADSGGRSDEDLIRMMMDLQHEEFERLGLDFQDLFGRPLQLIDCQNIFCEVGKYARARFPELNQNGGRVRIKQRYWISGAMAAPYFPPKWGINDLVSALFHSPRVHSDPPDLGAYQRHADNTSFHEPVRGGDAITTPMLGLIGETGEVVSELKKHAREGPAYVGFHDRLGEELGDLLWYVADLASRCDIGLADIARVAIPGNRIDHDSADRDGWIRTALALSDQMGRISRSYEGLLAGRQTRKQFHSALRECLIAVMSSLTELTRIHGLSLADVVHNNLIKVKHRWSDVARGVSPLASDRVWPENERLPPRFDAHLSNRRGRVRILFSIEGETTRFEADSLTDNAHDPDGYRFHDVFHLAYAAVLGWSPVTRSLLRRKRKSDARVDEVEDGGRAIAIEEGISAMVFAYAAQHRMLDGVKTVEDALLRTIRAMTSHLEVSIRNASEWQDAIIQGFAVWRGVRDADGGHVRVDRAKRRILLVSVEPVGTSRPQREGA